MNTANNRSPSCELGDAETNAELDETTMFCVGGVGSWETEREPPGSSEMEE
jgi:hypothetical protein